MQSAYWPQFTIKGVIVFERNIINPQLGIGLYKIVYKLKILADFNREKLFYTNGEDIFDFVEKTSTVDGLPQLNCDKVIVMSSSIIIP